MTSNDLKKTSNEQVKTTKKLKGDGDPSIIHIGGKDLIEQAFLSKQTGECIEIL